MIAAADSGCDSDGRQRSAIEAADSGPDSGVGQRSDSGGQRSVIVAEDSGRDSNGRDSSQRFAKSRMIHQARFLFTGLFGSRHTDQEFFRNLG